MHNNSNKYTPATSQWISAAMSNALNRNLRLGIESHFVYFSGLSPIQGITKMRLAIDFKQTGKTVPRYADLKKQHN